MTTLKPARHKEVSPHFTDRIFRVLSALVVFGFLLFGIFNLQSFPVSWDEKFSINNGEHALNWYLTFGNDDLMITSEFRQYGVVSSLISYLVHKAFSLDWNTATHATSFAYSLFCLLLTMIIARKMGGWQQGFVAGALLILSPVYFGHSFMNPRDIPLAAAVMLFIFTLFQFLREKTGPNRIASEKSVLTIGLAWGFCLGHRILAGMLIFSLLAWLGLKLQIQGGNLSRRQKLTEAGKTFGKIFVITVAFGFLLWPYALTNPLYHPLKLLTDFSYLHKFSTLYFGQLIPIDDLPWHFWSFQLASALGELHWFIFSMAFLGVCYQVIRKKNRIKQAFNETPVEFWILVVTVLAPVLVMTLRKPPTVNGIRYLMFVFPPLAVAASFLVMRILANLRKRSLQIVFCIVATWLAGTTLKDYKDLHPYEYVYMNRIFSEGPGLSMGQFEGEYFGLSLKNVSDWIRENSSWLVGNEKLVACSRTFFAQKGEEFNPVQYYLGNSLGDRIEWHSCFEKLDFDLMVEMRIMQFDFHKVYSPESLLYEAKLMGLPMAFVRWTAKTKPIPRPSF